MLGLIKKLVSVKENRTKCSSAERQFFSSSESDFEVPLLDSSDSDLQLEKNKIDSILKLFEILQINNFVLVEFEFQKTKIHYGGRIEKVNRNKYEIFFYWHKSLNKLSKPNIIDIHSQERYLACLPQPIFVVCTATISLDALIAPN